MENTCDSCKECPFKGSRVGSRGNIKSPIVIIGESPGHEEVRAGKPFVGISGQLLTKCLPQGVSLDDCYITNAMQCLPRNKNLQLLAKVTKLCQARLHAELSAHPRKMIIALGNAAVWSTTGNFSAKITQIRGQILKSTFAELGIMATIHPAFVLRGGGSIKHLKGDIQQAFDVVNGTSTKKYVVPKFQVLQTPTGVKKLCKIIMSKKVVAGDIETTGFDFLSHRVLCIGIGWDPRMTYVVPGEFIPLLKEAFECKTVQWLWHNGKFDIRFLRHLKCRARVDEDTMLLHYALDEIRGTHALDTISVDRLGCPNWKNELDAYLPNKKASYETVPKHVLYDYLAKDVSCTLQIFHLLRKEVADDPHLEKLYTKVLIPASELLYHVERRGFYVDWEWQKKNKERLEKELQELLQEIKTIVGYSINPASSIQVCKYVYDELGIRGKRRSSDADAVSKWPNMPFKKALQRYRKASKAYTTYVKGYFELVSSDNRVHPTFLIHGTTTGRLSCNGPNLMNIPREAALRGMYRAAPGFILLENDYSQAELRSLAVQSRDPSLLRIFNTPGMSLHKEVALSLFGPNYDGDQYVRAKALNFGIVYGREEYSIAEEFDIPVSEARRMIEGWFKRFPVAKEFIDRCRGTVVRGKTMVTIFGRKKRAKYPSPEMLKNLQNEAANFPHQSTASDFTLLSAIRVRPKLIPYKAGIVDLVHDSIIVECPDKPSVIRDVSALVVSAMEETPRLWGINSVPFLVDVKTSYNWGNPINDR